MKSASLVLRQAREKVIPSLAAFINKPLTAACIEDLVEDVLPDLPGSPALELVAKRASEWLGVTLSRKDLFPLALALLAWEDDDKKPPDKTAIECVVYIERVFRTTKNSSYTITMYAIGGPYAGTKLTWNGPHHKAYKMAELAGFPKYRGPEVSELSGMFHCVKIKKRKIVDVLSISALVNCNNKLRSKRKNCQYYDQYPCAKCPRGRDLCVYASRPITLVREGSKWTEKAYKRKEKGYAKVQREV